MRTLTDMFNTNKFRKTAIPFKGKKKVIVDVKVISSFQHCI